MFQLKLFLFYLLFKAQCGWVPTTHVMDPYGPNGVPLGKVKIIYVTLYYFLHALILHK